MRDVSGERLAEYLQRDNEGHDQFVSARGVLRFSITIAQ
jgi:hypothetical protein